MKKLIAAAAAVTLGLFSASVLLAADAATTTGVLIDNKCAGDKKEDAAAKHPKACALKCINGGEAAVVIVGDKKYKLDENGTKLAKEYLAKDENKSTKVKVTGEIKGDTIHATAIAAAEEPKKGA